MGIFAGVGIASMWVKQDTTDDYLVAGRGMHSALAALSAVTWNQVYVHWFTVHLSTRLFSNMIAGVDHRSTSRLDMVIQYIQKEGSDEIASSSLYRAKPEHKKQDCRNIISIFLQYMPQHNLLLRCGTN